MTGYNHGRELAFRVLHSSFRRRAGGFEGVIMDLVIVKSINNLPPEMQAGVNSVIRECEQAVRAFGRD